MIVISVFISFSFCGELFHYLWSRCFHSYFYYMTSLSCVHQAWKNLRNAKTSTSCCVVVKHKAAVSLEFTSTLLEALCDLRRHSAMGREACRPCQPDVLLTAHINSSKSSAWTYISRALVWLWGACALSDKDTLSKYSKASWPLLHFILITVTGRYQLAEHGVSRYACMHCGSLIKVTVLRPV